MTAQLEKPRWIRDLLRFLPLKSQFVLSGNVRDQFPLALAPGAVQVLPLVPYVCAELRLAGVQHFLNYDAAQGFAIPVVLGLEPAKEREFFQRFGVAWQATGRAPASLERLFEVLEQIARATDEPVALFADFASRLLLRPDLPTECEQRCFTRALVLAHTVQPRPVGADARPFFNPVFWIIEKEGDLPDWFVVGNPRLRHIPVPQPDHAIRRSVAETLGRSLNDATKLSHDDFQRHTSGFVEATDGLLISDLAAIVQLSRSEDLGFADIEEAVRRFKLGVTEDPWRKVNREKLRDAAAFVRRRVKGQTHAVTQMSSSLPISASTASRPRATARRMFRPTICSKRCAPRSGPKLSATSSWSWVAPKFSIASAKTSSCLTSSAARSPEKSLTPSLDHRTRRHQSTTRRVRGPGLQRCRRRDFYTKETK